MAMHTETALRLPAWTIAALVAVGVALGLWQVGVFERSNNNGGRGGTSALATTGQPHTVAAAPWADATAAESALTINRANGRDTEPSMDTPDQLARDLDPEVREESNALQAALAAEQASN